MSRAGAVHRSFGKELLSLPETERAIGWKLRKELIREELILLFTDNIFKFYFSMCEMYWK